MSGEHLSEEPQSRRGAPGSRDTGSDEPGGGPADRPAGTFEDEETTSARAHDPDQDNLGSSGSLPPGDARPAIPPYEGRTTHGSIASASAGEGTGANTAGAVHPAADPQFKAPDPRKTPGGATASPAQEQPATRSAEHESGDDDVETGHHRGVRRGEDQPRESSAR